MSSITLNGNDYNTDTDFRPYDYKTTWLTFFSDLLAEMASQLAMVAAQWTGTSSDSETIVSTGSISLEIESGKSFAAGQLVTVVHDETNYMVGAVSSYSGTTIAVDVSAGVGAGAHNSWTVQVSGPQGPVASMDQVGALLSALSGDAATDDEITISDTSDSGAWKSAPISAISTAVMTAFQSGLALLAPANVDASNDRLPIYDTSAGGFKTVAPSSVGAGEPFDASAKVGGRILIWDPDAGLSVIGSPNLTYNLQTVELYTPSVDPTRFHVRESSAQSTTPVISSSSGAASSGDGEFYVKVGGVVGCRQVQSEYQPTDTHLDFKSDGSISAHVFDGALGSNNQVELDITEGVVINPAGDNVDLNVKDNAGSSNLFVDANTGRTGIRKAAPKATLHSTGTTVLGATTAAVADGDMGNSEINIYLDEGANEIKFKIKKSDGSVRTGTLATS